MAEISINQKINNYLASHKELKGKSDEFILSLMAKDGVITQSEIDKLKSSSAFGFGHKTDNDFLGLKIEQITKTNEPVYRAPLRDPEHSIYRKLSSDEAMAVDMLQKTVNEAATTLENRDKEGGVVSHYVVNKWYELFNDELKKSNVEAVLNTLKKDIATLKLDNPNFTFSESFKISRGVDYSIMNLTDCKSKSEKYIQIKTATQMIKHTKTLLLDTTKGDVESQLNPEKSSGAIIQALQLCNKGSDKDVKEFLDNFCESTKNNPIMKKYGGKLQVFKNKKGEPVIYRETPNGREPATTEQLNLIARRLAKNLDKTFLMSMGVEVVPNATAKELAQKTQDIYDNAQREYQEAFSKAFGGKDAAILAEEYAAKEAQGVAYIEMGVNMLSMAAMLLPGVNVGVTGWLANATKATKVAQATAKIAQGAVAVQRGTQAISPLLMANVTLNPIELLEQLSSENGMSKEEWQEWGKSVIENGLYMALGMGASRGAEELAAMYKTRTLVTTLKNAGKTADEISAMIKSNPLKFPDEIINSMKKVDRMAKALQISTESALDLSTTYLANQALNNGDLTSFDWIMSIGTAMMGGAIQKQFAPLTTAQKIKRIHEAFKEYGATELDAKKILQTMDDISSGKIDANAKSQVLDEVEIKANDVQIEPEKIPADKESTEKIEPEIKHSTEENSTIQNKRSDNKSEIKLTENASATPSRAREILLELNFTEKEIEAIDLNDPKLLSKVEGFNYILKSDFAKDIAGHKKEIMDVLLDNSDTYDGLKLYNKENIELLKQHNITGDDIHGILLCGNMECINYRIKISDKLHADDRFDAITINHILYSTNEKNFDFIEQLCDNKELSAKYIDKMTRYTREEHRIEFAKVLCQNTYLRAQEIRNILYSSTKENVKAKKHVYDIISSDERFSPENVVEIATLTNEENFELIKRLFSFKCLQGDDISIILRTSSKENIEAKNQIIDLINSNDKFPQDQIGSLIYYTKDYNIELAKKLFNNSDIPTNTMIDVLQYSSKNNIKLADMLYPYKDISIRELRSILNTTNESNIELAIKLCTNERFPKDKIADILRNTTKDNINAKSKICEIICSNKDFRADIIQEILIITNNDNLALAEKLCTDKEFPKDQIDWILENTNKDNIDFVEKLCADKEFPKDKISLILKYTNNDNIAFAEKLCTDKDFPKDRIADILHYTNTDNIELAIKLCTNERFPKDKIADILRNTTKDNINTKNKIYEIICSNKDFRADIIQEILMSTNNDNLALAERLCADKEFPKDQIDWILDNTNKDNIDFAEKLCADKEFPINRIADILHYTNTDNIAFAERLCADKEFPKNVIWEILRYTTKDNIAFAEKLCADKEFPKNEIYYILRSTTKDNIAFAEKLCADKEFPKNEIGSILQSTTKDNIELVEKIYKYSHSAYDMEKAIYISQVCGDISNLSLQGKIYTLEVLTSLHDDILNIYKQYTNFDIDKIINYLNNAVGKKKDVISTPQEKQHEFLREIIANNNPKSEEILQTFDFEQYGKKGLPLKYSREEFTQNIEALLKDLSNEEQELLLEHFGLERGASGFDGMPNNKKFESKTASQEVKNTADKIKQEIENFTLNNEIKTGNPEIDRVLNGLIQGLPEFTSIVGKEQHDTHSYSVDIHTLKVLQSAINNPLYKTLSDQDKTILKISALLHDTGKRGGVVDKGHAGLSAEFTIGILDKYQFPQGEKDRILDIVENHHWFEAYNKGEISAQDVAIRCRRPEDFKIYEILSKADFENVNENFHLNITGAKTKEEFDQFMADKMKAIDDALQTMYSKSNLIFDTKFVRKGELFPRETILIDGEETTLKVLNLNKLKDDVSLQQYGFAKGTTKENARFIVHMTSPEAGALEAAYILTGNSLNQSAWSTSMVKADNNMTYWDKKFGYIFDVDQANISEAYYQNIASGYEKGLKTFKNIVFKSDDEARDFVKNNLLKELNNRGIELTDEEYAVFSKQLINKKYLTQINNDIKIGDKIIKAQDIRECLEISRDKLFNGFGHSEIVQLNPRVIGMIAKVDKLEDCPIEFLQRAKKYNLPIILMKPVKASYKIDKLRTLDRYKYKSNAELEKIAKDYSVENIDALVELGNLPQVKDGIFEIKIPDAYDITGEEVIQTKDGIVRKSIKVLKPEVEEQLWNIAKRLRARGLRNEKAIANFMKKNNLTPEGYIIEHRVKSLQSLYDKLKNFVLDDNNNDKTMFEALNDVRDAVGIRTIIPQKDYAHTPEVQALIAQGKKQEAVALAMQMQSQEIVTNFEKLIDKLMQEGFEDLGVVRFSNYKGDNGMPYVDQEKIGDIKLKIDVGFDDTVPEKVDIYLKHGIELKTKDFKTQTRKSGYTAFQVNFKTKKGYIYEWQFRGEKVNEFAEAEHIPYDLRTDKDITSANPNAKKIYEPIKEILSPQNMLNEDYNEYNQYLTKYYEYCRMIELGFTDEKPPEFNYKKFDKRLKGENLITLHLYADKMKKAKPSELEALAKEYESKLIN